MKANFTSLFSSTQFWLGSIVGLMGLIFGLGTFTFSYAEGSAYLSDDPQTCLNCHVMREQYDGWTRSSHRSVATCNDCHIPHRFPDKYVVEGLNGWNHSRAFTTGDFHEPIQIKPLNTSVVLENCVECHEPYVAMVYHSPTGDDINCITCHGSVGHDEFPSVAASQ